MAEQCSPGWEGIIGGMSQPEDDSPDSLSTVIRNHDPIEGSRRSGIYRGLRARISNFRQSRSLNPAHLFDDATRLLVLAMGLPLIDGVFASVVLSGALSRVSALVVSALTIFGGPWMLTIIINEMAGEGVRRRLRRVGVGAGLVIPAAGLEAVLAPTIASLLHMQLFHAFSALVILTVSVMIANESLAAYFPAPKWIVGAGMITSVLANIFSTQTVSIAVTVDPLLVAQAISAASIASLLASVVAIIGPTLDEWLDFDRFSLGSGISLALLPFSIAGIIPSLASLAVFGFAVVFSLDV